MQAVDHAQTRLLLHDYSVPDCYFIVDAQNEAKEAEYLHHHPRFNIDEDALPITMEVLTLIAGTSGMLAA